MPGQVGIKLYYNRARCPRAEIMDYYETSSLQELDRQGVGEGHV